MMRNPEKDRINAKLRLWETPGFSQFLSDLGDQILLDEDFWKSLKEVKRGYIRRLKEIEDEKNQLKQGKLDL